MTREWSAESATHFSSWIFFSTLVKLAFTFICGSISFCIFVHNGPRGLFSMEEYDKAYESPNIHESRGVRHIFRSRSRRGCPAGQLARSWSFSRARRHVAMGGLFQEIKFASPERIVHTLRVPYGGNKVSEAARKARGA